MYDEPLNFDSKATDSSPFELDDPKGDLNPSINKMAHSPTVIAVKISCLLLNFIKL
jgi:hypothetical protein